MYLDIKRLKPIKEILDEEGDSGVDYNVLKIVLAIFEYEYGIEANDENSSGSQSSYSLDFLSLTWSEI